MNKLLLLITALVFVSATRAYSHEDELMQHIGANLIKSIVYSAWCNNAETLLIVGSDYDNNGEIDACTYLKNAHGTIHVGDAPLIDGHCECIFPWGDK
jgi:hypothetical protein